MSGIYRTHKIDLFDQNFCVLLDFISDLDLVFADGSHFWFNFGEVIPFLSIEISNDIGVFLQGLRLSMHPRSSTVYPVSTGIPYLGFRVFPEKRLLKRRNAVAFSRRLRAYQDDVARGEMSLPELGLRVRGWVAHAAHGDTWGLRRSLLSASGR